MHKRITEFTSIEHPEIFIGLVGAVGTDLNLVQEIIQEELDHLNYHSFPIRMSTLLYEIPKYQEKIAKISNLGEDKRIDTLMDIGDDLRKSTNQGEALTLLAMSTIGNFRWETHKQNSGLASDYSEKEIMDLHFKPLQRQAYIFNSLKQPKEIEWLRKVYGEQFLLVSVYAPRTVRINNLAQVIASSYQKLDKTIFRKQAEELVERDQNSGDKHYGQNVSDSFPMGDVFIKQEDKESMRIEIQRVLQTWFGHPFHTPTQDEYGMFQAKSVSLRSADLSRQVGAAILSDEGDLLSVGCNEVPKPLVGLAWEGDEEDNRDWRLGYDSSAKMREEMTAELLKKLSEAKWLSKATQKKGINNLVKEALYDSDNPILKGARVTSILEFGRMIHAEMAAIISAARRGISVKGATLYCTTFPCHMCARHIIAAGIKRVVFIEPYPKSLAKELYKKEISIDDDTGQENSVSFEPFVGISPNKYSTCFSWRERKTKQGKAINWEGREAFPKTGTLVLSYPKIEVSIQTFLSDNREQFGFQTEKE